MLIEKRGFTGGMDGDTNSRELPPDVMLNLMNGSVGISEYGRSLRIENRPGTTQLSQSVYPPYGTNLCLGSCVDDARNRIIYFIWNSVGYHGIYCRDISAGITYAILYDSQVTDGLDFSKAYRIDRNCKVVGDLLYWTDNVNPPRRINIEAGIKMNHPSYSTTVTAYSWPMTQSVISWIRRPYGLPVSATKITSGAATNFLKDFAGQFASALIYRDGEPSVTSVPSSIVNYNLETDTYDAVQVSFPLSETFDQDVQIIQLLVRINNTPDYFITKEWNRANATDLAEINAHNSGSTALTFNFLNNKTGIAFGKAESVKPADSIGVLVKTIEYANNRMFHGNYTKGYDTPTVTSLTASLVVNGTNPAAAMALKCNSSYQIAIRFRDNGKRSCFAITNSSCILNVPDRSYSTVPYDNIAWVLSNLSSAVEIPDWAYYYDILVTKNLRTRFFISSVTNSIQYAKKLADGTYTYQSNYDSSVYAIAIDQSFLNSVQAMGYLFNEGDLCRIYLGNTATVYEFNILGQDGNYILTQPSNLGSFNPQPGCRFEIYTPYQPSENETFYTTGYSYTIANPTTGSRSYSTISGTIDGDVIRYNTLFGTFEAMSPNYRVWQNWLQFYGEETKQSILGQVNKKDFSCWSNPLVVGAQVNGLATFDSFDEKAIPGVGGIYKLQLANKVSDLGQGNIMLAVGATETASLYLGEVSVQGGATTAYIAQSSEVIGSVNVLTGGYGTVNPESVIQYLGLVFGFDVNNGVVWQYSPAGLEPVSRYKMSRFFQRYAKDYMAASPGNLDNINGFHHVPFGIDPFYKELICGLPGLIYENYATTLPSYSSVPSYATSIINRFDIYDHLQKAMAFKFEENKWGSNWNYPAEWFEYVENKMYAWKNGAIYEHNSDTSNWNTFYGVQYPVRLCFTGNLNPSALKVLNNICVESNVVPNFTVAYTDYPNIQITDLASTDVDINGNPIFENQEGQFYATFLKDRLSPNATGTADERLFTGDDLTDIAVKIMLEFQCYDSLIYVNFVDIGYDISRGQKQIINPINK